MWKPMNLTSDGLQERAALWATREPNRYSVTPLSEPERTIINPVRDTDHVNWGPELGRRVDGQHIIAGVHDDMRPLVIHIFFRGNTPAMRHLNVLADEAVAEVILSVLDNRYPPGQYKVEYYGQDVYQRTKNPVEIDLNDEHLRRMVSPFCMCCVMKESLFAGGPDHRNETVRLIDEALQRMEG